MHRRGRRTCHAAAWPPVGADPAGTARAGDRYRAVAARRLPVAARRWEAAPGRARCPGGVVRYGAARQGMAAPRTARCRGAVTRCAPAVRGTARYRRGAARPGGRLVWPGMRRCPPRGACRVGPVRADGASPRAGGSPGAATPSGGRPAPGGQGPPGGAAARATAGAAPIAVRPAVRAGSGGAGVPWPARPAAGRAGRPGACASDWPRGCSSARPPAEPMARAYPPERLTTCGQAFCRFQARLALTVIGYGRYPSQASLRISMPAVPAQRGWSRGGGCGDSLAWTTTPGAGPRIRSHM